jgi:phosphohistidine phosphatase
MELILWRHAEAEDNGDDDLQRELTKRGKRQAQRMSEWLRPLLVGEWRILVSPAKRTLQTVKALDMAFDVRESLGAASTPQMVLREAGWPTGEEDVLIVGHQPTLGQVAARLVGGAQGDVSIRKGAIWWFATRDRRGEQETILKAVLNPDLLDD